MRFFVGGPRLFGFSTGLIFSPSDLAFRLPRRSSRSEYVYVIEDGRGAVKIGITTCPQLRIAQLRTGSPTDLAFVAVAASSGRAFLVERRAHALLKQHRLSGEWFDVAPEEAVDIVLKAASQVGQTLHPVDPSGQVPQPPYLSAPERQRARQNMILVAAATIAALIAASIVIFAMLSTKVAAASHSDEIKTYGNAMAIAVFAGDRCPQISPNAEMLSDFRLRFHIEDEDQAALTDVERNAGRNFEQALAAAPSLDAWCDATYSLFGKKGSVLPGLLERR